MDELFEAGSRWNLGQAFGQGGLSDGVGDGGADAARLADERTKLATQSLIAALNAEGIEASARLQSPKNPKTNMININVGSKR